VIARSPAWKLALVLGFACCGLAIGAAYYFLAVRPATKVKQIAELMNYADSVKAKGNCGLAKSKYAEVLELDDYPPAQNALDAIDAGKCKEYGQMIAEYNSIINNYLAQGDCHNARATCLTWISFAPNDDPPKKKLAMIDWRIKNGECQ
jgi:hypothetical protein